MKKLLIGLLLITTNTYASDFYRDIKLYSSNVAIVNIYNDTTMSGTQNFSGKILNIYAKISGTCTLTNAIIIASPFIQIFDTTVTIGTGIQCDRFSGMWYGANPSLNDNSKQLQKAIDASINKTWPLYLPAGLYKTNDSLTVAIGYSGNYQQVTLRMYGDAGFWGDGGTRIQYSGNSFALGLQLNKGSEISNLRIIGNWISPQVSDSIRFNMPIDSFDNQNSTGNGVGLWVDYDGNFNQRSGSTGCYFHDIQVSNFQTDIRISNSISQNGEIMLFERLQLGDARWGVITSQPQEKLNVFRGVYAWGKIHTLFNIFRGNYYISDVNVVGCSRIFNIGNGGFFPVYVKNVYAENIGSIGSFDGPVLNISNSNFDFAYKSVVGEIAILTASSLSTKFDNCQFRYYGNSDSLLINGKATFDNCSFSGKTKGSGSVFISGADKVPVIYDTITQPILMKITRDIK